VLTLRRTLLVLAWLFITIYSATYLVKSVVEYGSYDDIDFHQPGEFITFQPYKELAFDPDQLTEVEIYTLRPIQIATDSGFIPLKKANFCHMPFIKDECADYYFYIGEVYQLPWKLIGSNAARVHLKFAGEGEIQLIFPKEQKGQSVMAVGLVWIILIAGLWRAFHLLGWVWFQPHDYYLFSEGR